MGRKVEVFWNSKPTSYKVDMMHDVENMSHTQINCGYHSFGYHRLSDFQLGPRLVFG